MSRKSERLVNLVIALLATRRSLTKSEIFRTIEGYEGSEDSMERMFERDKDELRSLGIDIDVSVLDPLFEDEQGYRIKPDSFAMSPSVYSAVQVAYMSLAAQLWKDASLSEPSQRVLRKLSGIASSVNIADIPSIAPISINAPIFLVEIINAISEARSIDFLYIDSDLNVNKREVNVYSYFSNDGFWYFKGLDINKGQERTFRSDRVVGEINVSKNSRSYEVPIALSDKPIFEESSELLRASLRVRVGRGSQLRHKAISIVNEGDHDLIEIEYPFEKEIISMILWHLDDVEVLSPKPLRERVIQSLQHLVDSHG